MSHPGYAEPVRVGVMQPYFLPHLSYFQLIANTDVFCLHDKVKYTKQSWINRNRFVINGKIQYITIPLRSSSDYNLINEKEISETFDIKSLIKLIELNYKKSPNFHEVFPLLIEILSFKNSNLFSFLENSIVQLSGHLELKTKIIRCSDTGYDQNLTKSAMVVEICKKLGAGVYTNSEGGISLYNPQDFLHNGILLQFSKRMEFSYTNSLGQADSSLSVIDTLMWADKKKLIQSLHEMELVLE
jgi:hypothetical protein